MPRFQLLTDTEYPSTSEARQGLCDEVFAWMRDCGLAFTEVNRVQTSSSYSAGKTIVFDGIGDGVRLDISFTCNTKYTSGSNAGLGNANIQRYLYPPGTASAYIQSGSYPWMPAILNGCKPQCELELIIEPDYIGLYAKNGKKDYSSSGSSGSYFSDPGRIFSFIKAVNAFDGTELWFYSVYCNGHSSPTLNYMQLYEKSYFCTKYSTSNSGSEVFKIQPLAPFHTSDKYRIQKVPFYNSHVAKSTYIGDESMENSIFTFFESGGERYYRDLWFINELSG